MDQAMPWCYSVANRIVFFWPESLHDLESKNLDSKAFDCNLGCVLLVNVQIATHICEFESAHFNGSAQGMLGRFALAAAFAKWTL